MVGFLGIGGLVDKVSLKGVAPSPASGIFLLQVSAKRLKQISFKILYRCDLPMVFRQPYKQVLNDILYFILLIIARHLQAIVQQTMKVFSVKEGYGRIVS